MTIQRKRVAKRLASGLLAGAMALGGLAISGSSPVSATAAPTATVRLFGADRYATAATIATTANTTNTKIVLVNGNSFADGLAASSIAGALSASILLTESDSIPAATMTALATLGGGTINGNTGTVVLVGGTSSISAGVELQLKSSGLTVVRFSGDDRYATADAVAKATYDNNSSAVGSFGGYKTVILASGVNFPDALAVSGAAYAGKHPIFLTNGTSLSSGTAAAIKAVGAQQVLIIGGESAISAEVKTAVDNISGVITTTRIAGADRYATATAWATTLATAGVSAYAAKAFLVSGTSFPDALVAAQYTKNDGAVILVNDSLPSASSAYLAANQATMADIETLGGTSAVSTDVVAAAKASATIAPLTATITAADGSTAAKVTFSGNVDSGSIAVTDFVHVNAFGAVVGAVTAGTYTAANALTGAPAQYTFTLSAAAAPGDIISLVTGGITTTAATGTVPVAGTSLTITASTDPVTAVIHAIAATAGGTSKIWVTFSSNIKAATVDGGAASADFVVTKGSGAIGAAAAVVGNCTQFGTTTTWECDALTNNLVAGDTVTLKKDAVTNTATTAIGNAATSATVVTDITKPVMQSVKYSMTGTGGDQAGYLFDSAAGDLQVKVRAAGTAGNSYKVAQAAAAAGSETCSYSAATKTLTLAADATSLASVLAGKCTADSDISALFAVTTPADGALTGWAVVGAAAMTGGKDLITLVATFSEPLLAAAVGDFTVTGLTVSGLAIKTDATTNNGNTTGVITLTGKTAETVVAGVDTLTVAAAATTVDRNGLQVDATNPPASNVVAIYAS